MQPAKTSKKREFKALDVIKQINQINSNSLLLCKLLVIWHDPSPQQRTKTKNDVPLGFSEAKPWLYDPYFKKEKKKLLKDRLCNF